MDGKETRKKEMAIKDSVSTYCRGDLSNVWMYSIKGRFNVIMAG